MELNINRLKLLGEEELKRLDEKIKDYQSSSEPTILTKSIDDIQRMIRDTNNIVVQLECDLKTKTVKLTKLHEDLLKLQNKYTKSSEDIEKLEKSIDSLQAEIDLKQVKFSEMDENIIRLKTNERVLKEQLTEVDSKLTVRTKQFLTERDEIQSQIRELEHKLKMSIQNSFTQHDEFVKQIKSIKLEPSIDDCQAIFDNIKMDLVLILSRNVEKYGKLDKEWIKYEYASGTGKPVCKYDYIRNFHSSLCKGWKFEGTLKSLCKTCSYICVNTNISGVDEHKIHAFAWLQKYYKQFLTKFITHTELKYISEKLDYTQFNSMFLNCGLFDLTIYGKPFTPYEFLIFIIFIGTDGMFESSKFLTLN